jgi:predicted metal-binding transcription factor (methanogenesis marker protein 9)
VYVAIADAYAALVRQLEDYVRTKREFEHKTISELPENSVEVVDEKEEDVS